MITDEDCQELRRKLTKRIQLCQRRARTIAILEARVEELEARITNVRAYCVCYKEAPTMIQNALDAVLRRLSDDNR